MIDIERLHNTIESGQLAARGSGQTFAMMVKVCQTLVDVDREPGETGNYLVVGDHNFLGLQQIFKRVADDLYWDDIDTLIIPVNNHMQYLIYNKGVVVSSLSFMTRDKLETNYTSYSKTFDDIFLDNASSCSKELDSKVINCLK